MLYVYLYLIIIILIPLSKAAEEDETDTFTFHLPHKTKKEILSSLLTRESELSIQEFEMSKQIFEHLVIRFNCDKNIALEAMNRYEKGNYSSQALRRTVVQAIESINLMLEYAEKLEKHQNWLFMFLPPRLFPSPEGFSSFLKTSLENGLLCKKDLETVLNYIHATEVWIREFEMSKELFVHRVIQFNCDKDIALEAMNRYEREKYSTQALGRTVKKAIKSVNLMLECAENLEKHQNWLSMFLPPKLSPFPEDFSSSLKASLENGLLYKQELETILNDICVAEVRSTIPRIRSIIQNGF